MSKFSKIISVIYVILMMVLGLTSYFMGEYKCALFAAVFLILFLLTNIIIMISNVNDNVQACLHITVRKLIKENKEEVARLDKEAKEAAKKIDDTLKAAETKRRPGRPRKNQ